MGNQIYWLNPDSGEYSQNTSPYFYSFWTVITCPGYTATFVRNRQLWGIYIPPVGEARKPNMRVGWRSP